MLTPQIRTINFQTVSDLVWEYNYEKKFENSAHWEFVSEDIKVKHFQKLDLMKKKIQEKIEDYDLNPSDFYLYE